jgi:hypothetical protein
MNFPLFDNTAAALRELGYDITSPAEMDSEEIRADVMQNESGVPSGVGGTWGDFLARDLKILADELNGIILLPEWETSRGARLEAFVSVDCGYPAQLIDPENLTLTEVSSEYIMEKINANL